MDISTINDINELKALGFHEFLTLENAKRTIEIAEQNIIAVKTRIQQLEKVPTTQLVEDTAAVTV